MTSVKIVIRHMTNYLNNFDIYPVMLFQYNCLRLV